MLRLDKRKIKTRKKQSLANLCNSLIYFNIGFGLQQMFVSLPDKISMDQTYDHLHTYSYAYNRISTFCISSQFQSIPIVIVTVTN